MSVSRWTGGNTFIDLLARKKKGRTASDKHQAQRENSENGDQSVRKTEKRPSAVYVRCPPDHVWGF
jgi:hypothetical protein